MPEPENVGSDPEEPVKVKVTGWRIWGDHPLIIGVTVLSSLIAIAQVFRSGPERQSAGDGAPPTCERIVGRWDWLSTGGVVAFTADGRMHWYPVPSNPVPPANGTWTCEDRSPPHLTLRWIETGLVDTLVLSADAERLVGENLKNHFPLSATRAR